MSDDFVGKLREITEEGDLDSILKSSFGGYTKKSVKEYLSFVKKQQQKTKDAYTDVLAQLQQERDAMEAETEALKAGQNAAAEELRQRMEAQAADMEAERAALEADMNEALERIASDEEKLRTLEVTLEEQRQKAEQYKQETATSRLLLDAANAKIEDQRSELEEKAAELAEQKKTEQGLRAALAEDKTAELRERIRTLMGEVELLQNEVTLRDRELENRALRLETLTKQEQSNHAALEELRQRLQAQTEQNEWIECENDELGKRLQEQMKQGIALGRENSHLKAANAILQRKLDGELARRQAVETAGETGL